MKQNQMRENRLFILVAFFILLGSFNRSSLAANSQDTLMQPINYFYQWANAAYGHSHHASIAPADLQNNLVATFAPNIIHYLNGIKVASNRIDLYHRFLKLNTKYRSVDVVLPFDDVVIDEAKHKVAIQYRIKFISQEGQQKLLYAQSIFTVIHGKITQFNEVSTPANDHL